MFCGAVNTSIEPIGKHVHMNLNATVSHDCVLEDYVTIGPGATVCGNCHLGECAEIGAGATVIQGINIGRNAIVGAGAVVIRDVPDNAVVVGNPAKFLRWVREDE
jgi:acetyltransferase EpsM